MSVVSKFNTNVASTPQQYLIFMDVSSSLLCSCFTFENEIEDELHFVCVCPVYSNHRKILFNEIILTYNNFSNLDITEKFCFIMATGTKYVLNYVENAWNTRKSLLYA